MFQQQELSCNHTESRRRVNGCPRERVRLHDRYDAGGYVDMTGRNHAAETPHACYATGKEASSS
jgi:hypothetical protein